MNLKIDAKTPEEEEVPKTHQELNMIHLMKSVSMKEIPPTTMKIWKMFHDKSICVSDVLTMARNSAEN